MAWLQLLYHHLTYWLIGTSPEEHHWNLARDWYILRRFRKCIEHCNRHLNYSDSADIRSMLAYSYWSIGEWQQAVSTYRSLPGIWSCPGSALRLAEAELRCGRLDEAQKIVATVEVSHPNPKSHEAMFLRYIKKEIQDSANSR